jgi:hypothetical protein
MTSSISIGMEFQTEDANFLLRRIENGQDIVYYTTERKSFEVDKNCNYVVSATGDACTNDSIKHFKTQHLKHGHEITFGFEDDHVTDLYLKVDENMEQIFNDAEFDVLFPEPRELEMMDRISLLNSIIESIKNGAGVLLHTLKADTVRARLSSIRLDDQPLDKKSFPYKQVFLFKDKPYCMMTRLLQPFPEIRWFTQITLGIPFHQVLHVLRLLTAEMLQRADSLHAEDRQQLDIFLNAETDVARHVAKEDATVYTMAVMLVYWIRTKANRKASPFIFRHYMTSLIKQILSPEETQRLVDVLHMISPEYNDVFGILRLMALYHMDQRRIRHYQKTGPITTYEMKSNIILVEIRFVYALLDTWCRTDNGFHTLGALSRMPGLVAESKSRRRG